VVRALLAVLGAALAASCAPQHARLSSADAAAAWRDDTSWAFEKSDIPVDPGFRFGRLANGMRYIVRANRNPAGTVLVRMDMHAGSLDEHPDELGYAHFIEHMAFNGSAHVPEGEMVKLLERDGLAFGADTNASTSFEQTDYRLDLPRNDAKLIDTALMLMRETASELSFDPGAVDREKGVVLSEMRDRNDFQYRNSLASAQFFNSGSLYTDRFPIGTVASVSGATAAGLKAFWRREYVPANATIVVIGDIDPAAAEQMIRARFGDWAAAPAPSEADAGPIKAKDRDRTAIWLDPALSERVIAARHGPWLIEPDTVAQRRESVLRQIGYAIINRRLIRIARQADPPFRGAGFGSGDDFESARTTRLIVDSIDGKWRTGLAAAARELRRALKAGFTSGEVAEQVAAIRTATEVAASQADTRSNALLVNAALELVRDRVVPSDPRTALERLQAYLPEITPQTVLAALKREAVPLKAPLIRFQGRRAPEGGEKAIRAAWRKATGETVSSELPETTAAFAYTSFGAPGMIVSDTVGPLGIREIRFANGVMLNLKRTDIEKGSVLVKLSIDGGDRLETKADPLAVEMFDGLRLGGLGKHSEDDLQTILAGRSVASDFISADDSFTAAARTTPQDLDLQLKLYAAFVTDPGYRPEGETQYRVQINNFFLRKDATPGSALQTSLGGILSDRDPRFTLQPVEAYRKLTYARLKTAVSERLAHGAIEIGIVGDVDEADAIRAVAATFGALPAREQAFGTFASQPPRPFTTDTTSRVIRHTGAANQALLRLTFATRDDADPVEALQLSLLEKVVRITLTDTLREALGKAYSPSASSQLSHVWAGYGTFDITASIDVREVPAARAAILASLRDLISKPIDPDLLDRARAPLLQTYANGLKTDFGWLTLVDRAQTQSDRIDRYLSGTARLQAITPGDLQTEARRYLDPARGIEVLVLPQGVDALHADTGTAR
jgi:zinc protease